MRVRLDESVHRLESLLTDKHICIPGSINPHTCLAFMAPRPVSSCHAIHCSIDSSLGDVKQVMVWCWFLCCAFHMGLIKRC